MRLSEKRKKVKQAVARYCGNCGYELARDNDGTCPMCPRFEQLRTEFGVPTPTDIADETSDVGEQVDADATHLSAERPPTISEYRAVIAAQRARWASSGGSGGASAPTVIRTRALIEPAAARNAEPPNAPTVDSVEARDQPTTPVVHESMSLWDPPSAQAVDDAPIIDATSAPRDDAVQRPGARHRQARLVGPRLPRFGIPRPSAMTLAVVVIGAAVGALVPLMPVLLP